MTRGKTATRKKSHDRSNRAVGQRIKDARQKLKLTQGDIAARLGITTQQVSRYESGENGADAATLMEIAKVLGCGAGEFLDGVEA